MSAKFVLVLCAQAFFVQIAFSQCTSRAAIDASGLTSPYGWAGSNYASPAMAYDRMGANFAYDGFNLGCAGRGLGYEGFYAPALDFTPSSGGGLPVTSYSAISPTGLFVNSENAYEGALNVIGEMPFVSAVALEGRLPTEGIGAINFGCGNGIIAMMSEGIAPNAAVAPGAFGPVGAFGPGATYGPGAGYGPGAFGIAPSAFGPANGLGLGGCGCGRGMLY